MSAKTVHPLTPEEEAKAKERHVFDPHAFAAQWSGHHCLTCCDCGSWDADELEAQGLADGCWPCETAKALATLDAERAMRKRLGELGRALAEFSLSDMEP